MRSTRDMVNWLTKNANSTNYVPGARYIPSVTENIRKGRPILNYNNFRRGDFDSKWEVFDPKALDSYITRRTKRRPF